MIAILKKELNSFFSTPIGYLVITTYLIINGLFLWVFDSDFNILRAGFADLNSYFSLAPWIFLFLVPAITMKSFSDEINSGTIEILKTKPISTWEVVLGKFIGSLLLVLIAILPTFIYIFTIYQLGNPIGNINLGTTFGSFIGLLFLSSAYVSIGIYASTFSKNQIVSFISGLLITFLLFYGFEAFSSYNIFGDFGFSLKKFGILEHFNSIGKGVLDTRDLIYFISVSFLFLFLTKINVENEN